MTLSHGIPSTQQDELPFDAIALRNWADYPANVGGWSSVVFENDARVARLQEIALKIFYEKTVEVEFVDIHGKYMIGSQKHYGDCFDFLAENDSVRHVADHENEVLQYLRTTVQPKTRVM